IWQDQCSPSIMFRIAFGPKQLTRLVIPLIDCIAIDFITRPHMSCSLEGSQISHILECLVANAIFSRRELGYQSSKVNVMNVFFLGYSSCSKAYRVYNKTHGIVEEAYDVEFDETNGSHDEQENLDDVRSDGLR